MEVDKYKVSAKYKYVGDKGAYKPGDVFKQSFTVGYKQIEGIEFTLDKAGKLIVAVDKMLYDISNQWESGMDIEEFIADIRKIMVSEVL